MSKDGFVKWDILNYNELRKVVSLSPDGMKFQFSSGGLFQLNFGVFQIAKNSVEILVNNSVIAKGFAGKARMIKVGDATGDNSIGRKSIGKENREGNGMDAKVNRIVGVTFQDYLFVEFGSWIGVRFARGVDVTKAQAFIKIVKV